MSNLLLETSACLETWGLKSSDITFIGSQISGHECTWEEFQKLANRYYDDGYGGHEVALDLVIVFKDGTKMRRQEYDGSEWWECIRPFKKPSQSLPIFSLFGYYLSTANE